MKTRAICLVLATVWAAPAAVLAAVPGLPPTCKVPVTTPAAKPRIVVADLAAKAAGSGAKAAAALVDELDKELDAKNNDVELTRANCVVASTAEARALANAWNARLVVWGEVPSTTAGSNASVSRRVTLGANGARAASNGRGLGLGSLDEVKLPSGGKHASTLVLGLQFMDRPNLAMRYFESATALLPIDPKTDLVPLYRTMGLTFLKVPGGPEKLQRIAETALKSPSVKGTAAESELLTLVGIAASDMNRHDVAFHNLTAALALDTKLKGSSSERVAEDLDNISGILARQGNFSEATKAAEQSLAILTKLYGDRDPRSVPPLTRLGVILTENGVYPEGLAYLSRALEIDKRAAVAWRVPEDLNNVAWNLAGQGNYAAAITTYREALALGSKQFAPKHPWLATCRGNLAWALSGQGQHDAAIVMLRGTIDELATPDGSEDATIAAQLEHLGSALIMQQKFAEARVAYARAQSLNQRIFGNTHPTTLWVQRKYARAIAATSGWRQGASPGAVVWNVQPGSPASALGLRIGDWITEYGTAVKSVPHLQELSARQPSGQQVAYLRDGKKFTGTSTAGVTGAELYVQSH